MNKGKYVRLPDSPSAGRRKTARDGHESHGMINPDVSTTGRMTFRKDSIIYYMHLSTPSYNLSAQNFYIIRRVFETLAFNKDGDSKSGQGEGAKADGEDQSLDDVMFKAFFNAVVEPNSVVKADKVFELFDTDMGNSVDFDEFYLCVCILIAIKDNVIGHFFEANTRVCFDLLDTESLGMITKNQVPQMSILLDVDESEVARNFTEFDTSHDEALDYDEFRLFALRCIDSKDSANQMKHVIDSEIEMSEETDGCCAKCWENLLLVKNTILKWFTQTTTY